MANDLILSPPEFTKYLSERQDKLAELCAGFCDPKKVIKMIAILLSNPNHSKLLNCTKSSLFLALSECLQLGLMPQFGRAYFIPYGNKASFMLGYQGMIELAARAGIEVRCFNVFKEEYFDWNAGAQEWVDHKPSIDVPRNKETLRGTYVISWYRSDERVRFDVMSKEEIETVRRHSISPDGTAWRQDYLEMARKTCVRRAAKYWNLTSEIAEALEQDDNNSNVFEVETTIPENKTATSEVKEKILSRRRNAEQAPKENVIDAEFQAVEPQVEPQLAERREYLSETERPAGADSCSRRGSAETGSSVRTLAAGADSQGGAAAPSEVFLNYRGLIQRTKVLTRLESIRESIKTSETAKNITPEEAKELREMLELRLASLKGKGENETASDDQTK